MKLHRGDQTEKLLIKEKGEGGRGKRESGERRGERGRGGRRKRTFL